ncbi:FAD-dependent monooxygenase [Streptomyces sp. SP18CS02]|uniref:FAD-dependent monooxygenase n=1 Tax=Streptomyces sp. SP18CS02 TaxID=3002531 RepID=UPI002E7895EB|nr:FAD-dependent monooxygenase [Streptomyces sp. SP18CS02]MEE1752755.1 FAD-dependent monooxygenase [Streptomyces sp. SP18CS02]
MTRRMRVTVVGGGAAGLWAARRFRDLMNGEVDVELFDDQPSEEGLGIVLESSFVSFLDRTVPGTGDDIRATACSWDRVTVRTGGREVSAGGHHIHGLARGRLRAILRERVRSAGVTVREGRRLRREETVAADLVVAADGAGSTFRQALAGRLGTRIRPSRTGYLWASVRSALVRPGFLLVPAGSGQLVGHTYPFGPGRHTMVVEGPEELLRATGLWPSAGPQLADRLTALFRSEVPDLRFDVPRRGFRRFRTVSNEHWSAGRTVLAGDAAHTTHFSIGSGTALAIEDAEALARHLAGAPSLDQALRGYQSERAEALGGIRLDAEASEEWFAGIGHAAAADPYLLMFALRTRRDITSYAGLLRRDPGFVREVMRRLAAGTDGAAERPSALPLRLSDGLSPTGRILAERQEPGLPRGVTTLVDTAQDTGTGSGVPVALLADGEELMENGALRRPGRRLPLGLRLTGTARPGPGPDTARWDFLAVPAGPGPRVLATRAALSRREASGKPVGLLAPRMSRDEADTLIAAGRVDFVIRATGEPEAGGTLSPAEERDSTCHAS